MGCYDKCFSSWSSISTDYHSTVVASKLACCPQTSQCPMQGQSDPKATGDIGRWKNWICNESAKLFFSLKLFHLDFTKDLWRLRRQFTYFTHQRWRRWWWWGWVFASSLSQVTYRSEKLSSLPSKWPRISATLSASAKTLSTITSIRRRSILTSHFYYCVCWPNLTIKSSIIIY